MMDAGPQRVGVVLRDKDGNLREELRVAFWFQFSRGRICSIAHGIDYFDNVIGSCTGTLVWDEKGEYGDNFRKMIAERPKKKP